MIKISVEDTKEFINMIEISLLKLDKTIKRSPNEFLTCKAKNRVEKLIILKKNLSSQMKDFEKLICKNPNHNVVRT